MTRLETFAHRPGGAYLLVIIATCLWGSSAVILRAVHSDVPPVGLSFWRAFTTAAVLFPFVVGALVRQKALIARHWRLILFLGVAQVSGMTFMTVAAHFTTAVNLALVNASQPALTAVVAWVLIRERMALPQVAGIGTALIGITVMTVEADWEILASLSFNGGDMIMLLAVLGWSLYAVKMPGLPREFGLATLLFMVMLSGSLCALPFYVAESIYYRPMPLSWTALASVASLAIFVTLLAVNFWNAGLRVVGANLATIFMSLIPVFGAGLAIVTLGERLFPYHYFGAALVCGGITLVIRFRPQRPQGEPLTARAR